MRKLAPLAPLLALVVSGPACTLDFEQFQPTGAGGSTTTTTTSTSIASSSTGTNDCVPMNCDDSDPCTDDVCTAGTCTHPPKADGTPVSNLDPLDCLQTVCMAGAAASVADDSEVPSDGNDCTDDSCSGGSKVFTPRMDGSTCGAGLAFMCYGGLCGCNQPSDCGANGECGTRTCTGSPNKTCGWNYTASMTDSPTQTAGDCVKRVCNGSSETADVVADTSDPTSDALECTVDTCQPNGTTLHPAAAPGASCTMGGTECGGGALSGTCCMPNAVCSGLECGMLADSCNVMKTCGTCMTAGMMACVANLCEECAAAGDCTTNPKGHACITGSVCGCTVGGDCSGATPVCDTGNGSPKENQCVQCAASSDCASQPTNKTCDTTPSSPNFDTCVECTSSSQCSGGTPVCASVAPGIGTCVECDMPSNNSSDCPNAGMKKCLNHVCTN